MLGAKAARDTSRLAIDAYTAILRERAGMEAPTFRRERPWMNGERAVRFRWSREEPNVAHVLGSNLWHVGMGPGDSDYFPGLRTERVAADPLGDPFLFGFTFFPWTADADVLVQSPLEPGSERHYQFRSGDTLIVTLSDGSAVRAVSVSAIPRYRSVRLVSAILWIEPEAFGLVRVAYRPAKKIDREISWRLRQGGRWSPGLDVEVDGKDAVDSIPVSDSARETPGLFDRLVNGLVNNSIPRFEMDVPTVVVEYGLWEMRHWLPRAGRLTAYMGAGEGITAAGAPPVSIPWTIDWTVEIEDIRERGMPAAESTPATAAETLELWRQDGDSISGDVESDGPGETVTITPADREALATSGFLPPTLWEEDRGFHDDALDEIASALVAIGGGGDGDRAGAANPWTFDPPGKTVRLLRYNPVERVSVGTRLRRDFGWGNAALTTRVGTGGLDLPDIDLTLQRHTPGSRIFVSFYRTLRGGAPGQHRRSLGLYEAGDAADLHWSHGAAVRIMPAAGDRNWLSLRLFAEQDADVGSDTTRNRVGASLGWRPWRGGYDFGSFGGGGRASVRGSAGDNPHVRAVAEAVLVVPLPGRMSLGLQTGIARVWGDPAPHDLWRIGGTGDWLRGHDGAVRSDRVAMGRVDLQRRLRSFRFSVFGDWARASGKDFYTVGAGVVLWNGIMRVDVARGLQWGGVRSLAPALRVHLLDDVFF